MNTKVLFEEYREDILECVHHGTVCVVNKDGIAAAVGDPGWICYYRSASKPIQSLPVLIHGLDLKYGLTEEETALFSGSHWGNVINLREKMAICTVNTIFSFSHPFYCCHFAQSNKILYVYILYKNTSMHL